MAGRPGNLVLSLEWVDDEGNRQRKEVMSAGLAIFLAPVDLGGGDFQVVDNGSTVFLCVFHDGTQVFLRILDDSAAQGLEVSVGDVFASLEVNVGGVGKVLGVL